MNSPALYMMSYIIRTLLSYCFILGFHNAIKMNWKEADDMNVLLFSNLLQSHSNFQ